MPKDIIFRGVEYHNVPQVELPQVGGGFASFGTVFKQGVMRQDAELVKTWSADDLFVEDLEGTIPAYSSSAVTLLAVTSLSDTYSLSGYADYNYYVLERLLTTPIYNTDSPVKGRQEYVANSILYEIVEIPASTMKTASGKYYTTRSVTTTVAGNTLRYIYWTSATAISMATVTTYGVQQVVQAPSISSSVLTVKTPVLQMRGSSTYIPSAVWNTITDIRRQYVIEVWRAPKNNFNINGWGVASNLQKIIDCQQENNGKLV